MDPYFFLLVLPLLLELLLEPPLFEVLLLFEAPPPLFALLLFVVEPLFEPELELFVPPELELFFAALEPELFFAPPELVLDLAIFPLLPAR
jgi:hypothetical protein